MILVACEYSGVVRDAFTAKGFEAMSCDLLPSEGKPGGEHYQGDVRDILHSQEWELVIAHPECTYLTNAGVRWLHSEPGRWAKMREGAEFFRMFLELPGRVAVENPIMHRYAKEIVGVGQTQVVQPWMFGHTERKGTGLWLKNLPPLYQTHDMRPFMVNMPKRETDKVHYASPGKDRWKIRSRTYEGIARAMADQWGKVLRNG